MKIVDELKRRGQEHEERSTSPPTRTAKARRSPGTSRRSSGCRQERVHRVLFNEITKKAVQAAIKKPGRDRPEARSTPSRRAASSTAWSATRSARSSGTRCAAGLSAGPRAVGRRAADLRARARDPGLRPEEYWIARTRTWPRAPAARVRRPRSGSEPARRSSQRATEAETRGASSPSIERADASWSSNGRPRSERRKNPPPPFITSTLQQDAARKLRFSAPRRRCVAQRLYEGVELGEEGAVGLITYMRTDSTRVSADAQAGARRRDREPVRRRVPARRAAVLPHQEVGAGRPRGDPAHVARSAARAAGAVPLSRDRARALHADLEALRGVPDGAAALRPRLTVDITAGAYLFRATGSGLGSPASWRVYIEALDEPRRRWRRRTTRREEPGCRRSRRASGSALEQLDPKQHFTQPPPRFTEARWSRSSRRRASAGRRPTRRSDDDPEARVRPEGPRRLCPDRARRRW